jgi:DNA-directed RNA polymerase subunit N (RpoN/RPB10)
MQTQNDIPLNCLCPTCGGEAGHKAENYGHMSGIYETCNCANCGQFLVSDFSHPYFRWSAKKNIDEVMDDRVEWENQYIK